MSKPRGMDNDSLREKVARAIYARKPLGSLSFDTLMPGEFRHSLAFQQADAALAALGLLDMDGFVRRLHEGYFDDDGPSAVELACMLSAVEYAFSATEGTDK